MGEVTCIADPFDSPNLNAFSESCAGITESGNASKYLNNVSAILNTPISCSSTRTLSNSLAVSRHSLIPLHIFSSPRSRNRLPQLRPYCIKKSVIRHNSSGIPPPLLAGFIVWGSMFRTPLPAKEDSVARGRPKQVRWKTPCRERKICFPLRISRTRISSSGPPSAREGMVMLPTKIVKSMEMISLGPNEPFQGRMKI